MVRLVMPISFITFRGITRLCVLPRKSLKALKTFEIALCSAISALCSSIISQSLDTIRRAVAENSESQSLLMLFASVSSRVYHSQAHATGYFLFFGAISRYLNNFQT